MSEVCGVVIGVVLRTDDDEDKLIVAPAGMRYTADDVRELIDVQERSFQSRILVLEGSE